MTKEEKIKENYINEFQTGSKEEKEKRYENIKPYIDSFGWFSGKLFETNKDNFDVSGHETRPKSLSGIENNLGWIKIESEADLPKKELDCHFIFKQNDKKYQTFGVWDNKLKSFWSGALRINYVTYYQPIEKPQPPIY